MSTMKLGNDLKKVTDTEGIDIISSLPDEILGQVLSFLPTKYAVATSVLSTRWRYLFKLITNLNFDDFVMFKKQNAIPKDQHHFSSFKCFVERVLRQCRSPNKHSFTLKCCTIYLRTLINDGTIFNTADINAFLSSVVAHNFKEIDIFIIATKWCNLPPHILDPCLFNCVTLKILKLNGNFCLDVPMSFCLPSLEVVHLDSVEFLDSDSIARFFNNCPTLEEFTYEENKWNEVRVINISSPTLKRLVLYYRKRHFFTGMAVVLNCPKLVYLYYSTDGLASHYSLGSLHALVEAKIYITDKASPFVIVQSSLVSLLSGLSNVTRLTVQIPWMEPCTLPVFYNLSELRIYSCDEDELRRVEVYFQLLNLSQVLKKLIFAGGLGLSKHYKSIYEEDAMVLLRLNTLLRNHVVPSCLSNTLKTIEVHSLMGSKEEFEFIKFFLINDQVLEEMKLYCVGCITAAEKRELLQLPVCSERCSITFV